MSLAAQVQSAVDLSTVVCGQCSGVYAIAERYREGKYRKGGFWNCPYCQCSWGYGTSELSRVKDQLAESQRLVEQERKLKEWARQEARNTERRRIALKGQITKVKNRIGHGVCPCCKRNFENLRRHMLSKHPAYTRDKPHG